MAPRRTQADDHLDARLTMWHCPTCSTVNSEADQTCVVCGFERLKVGTRATAPEAPSPWVPPPTVGSAGTAANDPVAATPASPPIAAPLPPARRGSSTFLLLVTAVIVGLTASIITLVLTSRDDDSIDTDDNASVPQTTITSSGTDSPTVATVADPPSSVATSEPSAPPPTDATPDPAEILRGHIVAVLWSGFDTMGPVVNQQRDHWTERVGPPVVEIDGNWYRSLRDGTVAVAYDGGFGSVRSAAQWCQDNGLGGANGVSCFGVILNDQFSENDKGDGQGRFYPAAL